MTVTDVEHLRQQVLGLSSCAMDDGKSCELCVEAVDALIAAVRQAAKSDGAA